ncbi:MAG: hypothetical protein OWU32_03940, partial [Firmicutes bacterium]|nr:hypothetical protein [Bacillota bacterium]
TAFAQTRDKVNADGRSRIACVGFSVPVELNLQALICAAKGVAFRCYWRAPDGGERAMLEVCQHMTGNGLAAVKELAQGWDEVR